MIFMKNAVFCLAFTLVVFYGCTTDAGFDPRDDYKDEPVDYIVDVLQKYKGDYFLPDCDEKLQDKIFFVNTTSFVYACVGEDWAEIRSLDKNSKELSDVPYYDPARDKLIKDTKIHDVKFGEVTDSRDGHTYATVIIDGMEWMAENLDYDDTSSIVNEKCASLYGAKNCRRYERLFNADTTGYNLEDLCPQGFYVPDEKDWIALFKAVSIDNYYAYAANVLKSKYYVDDRNHKGEDLISFSVIPAGFTYRESGYLATTEAAPGKNAGFWSSYGDGVFFRSDLDYVVFSEQQSKELFSIRCMRSIR